MIAVALTPALVTGKRNYGVPTRHLGFDVNGESVDVPLVGEGSWLYNSTIAKLAVKTAFTLKPTPFRHIDTAYDYFNSDGIGEALTELNLKRESFFVTTKIEGGLSMEDTIKEHAVNLKNLSLSYVDLLLVHFPCDLTTHTGGTAGRQAQWRALEAQYMEGKARAIGVSHFCERHMEDIYSMPPVVKPMVNQVQFHVGMGTAGINATDLTFEYCKKHGLVYQSFSPLCGPCCMGQPDNCTMNRELLTGDLVTSIGAKYNKTGAQVSLRWQVQQHIPVIPKSGNPVHLAQNIDLFSWELSEDDMHTLTSATSPPVGGVDGKISGDCGLP